MIRNLAALGAVVWLTTLLFFYVQINRSSNGVPEEVMQKWEGALNSLNKVREQNEELKRLVEQERAETNALKSSIISLSINSADPKRNAAAEEPLDLIPTIPELSSSPSRESEIARRELDNQIQEMFYYIHGLKSSDFNEKTKNVATEQLLSVLAASSHLEHADNAPEARKKAIQKIRERVVKALDKLQNPDHCKKARALICDLEKECGFGCELHHVTYCAITAFATNRMLVLKRDGSVWRYSKQGWNAVFLPVSKCSEEEVTNGETVVKFHQNARERVLNIGIIDTLSSKPGFLPLAVPEQLVDDMTKYHSIPSALFVGFFIEYLMRPNDVLKKELATAEKSVPFSEGPIVGLQVRRTDKIGTEAAYHGVNEYMEWAEHWFQVEERRHGANLTRRVFIASDDPTVVPETKKNYPAYQVYGSTDIAKTAQLDSRYTDASLLGVVTDIVLLSKVDYIVCTFSSQVCRTAFELKQPTGKDDGTKFHSMDDIYYFGGQQPNNVIAVESHEKNNDKEISFRKGDKIGIAGNHWDGFSLGTNRRTGQNGLFPSYKTRYEVLTYKFQGLEESS